MFIPLYNRVVSAACIDGDLLLVAILFLRRRASSFPIFTVYIAVEAAITIALNCILGHTHFHAYVDWYAALYLLDQIIQLMVFYEIAVHVFRPTGKWKPEIRNAIFGVAVAGVTIALVFALLALPPERLLIQRFEDRAELFYLVLMSELIVGMLVLSRTAGLPWKTHAARIAQGFGALSLITLALQFVDAVFGMASNHHMPSAVGRLRMLVQFLCEVFWIVMLWRDAPAPQQLPDAVRTQIYRLQQRVENDLIRIRSWRSN